MIDTTEVATRLTLGLIAKLGKEEFTNVSPQTIHAFLPATYTEQEKEEVLMLIAQGQVSILVGNTEMCSIADAVEAERIAIQE